MIVFAHNNSVLATCKANGKEYQVGQSFIPNNCTATCTCSGQDRIGCVSLCPPALVNCKQGEKKSNIKIISPTVAVFVTENVVLKVTTL